MGAEPGFPPRGAVLVVGEALIDAVEDGAASRPVVDAGSDAPARRSEEHIGGSPANVALGLSRLGASVRLRTALARDEHGKAIASHLAASHVVVDEASYCLERTAVARAVTAADGSARYTFDMEWRLPGQIDVAGVRLVHAGSIACFLEPGATALEGFLVSLAGRIPISFDPNIRRQFTGPHAAALARVERLGRLSSVVKLSDEDAGWLYPALGVDAVLDRLLGLGPRLVVVTLGGGGAALASRTARVRVQARRVLVHDTVGAGDSFMAGLLDRVLVAGLGTLDAATLQALGRHAASAASITVSRAGADLPTRAELERASAASLPSL